MININSSLDFIQPSGGNIDHVHNIKLLPLGDGSKPQGTSPTLPSGSVWLRPNDGQAERLEYQGRDSQFQIRPTEGYAHYLTVVPRVITPPQDVIFDQTIIEDTRFFSLDSSDKVHITVHVSGLYRISGAFRVINNISARVLIELSITKNDSISIGEAKNFGPSTGDGGGAHVSINVIAKLDVGDLIHFLFDASGFDTTTLHEGNTVMEFIRPLDLGNESNII